MSKEVKKKCSNCGITLPDDTTGWLYCCYCGRTLEKGGNK
jgi:hypothetical protein